MSDESTVASTGMAAPVAAHHVAVAVPVPLRRTFTYRVPAAWQGSLAVGCRVVVPFGRRKLAAFVVAQNVEAPAGATLKEVIGRLDPEPVFPPELLEFLREAADYYLHPFGEVLRAAAPALPADALRALRARGALGADDTIAGSRVGTRTTLKVQRVRDVQVEARLGSSQHKVLAVLEAQGEAWLDELREHVKSPRAVVRALEARGLVTTERVELPSDPFFATAVPNEQALTLNPAQRDCAERVAAALGTGGAFLLHGVTGSGKTEVYLQVIARARSRGLGALVLVPEIALTPQLVARFRARFGNAIAVLHSGLGERERHEAWRGLREGRVSLAIGARSALFAPVERLGVVVVDEEHDASFKQEEGFRYHARDMALLRAHRAGAVCILGSATPSLETYHLSERGRVQRLELHERATGQSLPPVEVVDLTRQRRGPSGHYLLTGPLYRALEACLARGEQSILFLNRRGYSPSVVCKACGELVMCPACSIGLTEHRRMARLACHSCGFERPVPERCPSCAAQALELLGLGTERLEDALVEAFPQARVGRLDRDTAGGRNTEAILDKLRHGEIDVLVGTQMVTKGHDVPNVTLVGVILADQALAFPDFRASERTFQLLSQVAGRAGRGTTPGQVILQTYQPTALAVRHAQQHDYLGFYRSELESRRELGYTPFSRLVMVRVDAADAQRAQRVADLLAQVARQRPEVQRRRVRLLGPAKAPVERLRARYRFRFMLQSPDRPALRQVAMAVASRIDEGVAPARAHVDVDPVAML